MLTAGRYTVVDTRTQKVYTLSNDDRFGYHVLYNGVPGTITYTPDAREVDFAAGEKYILTAENVNDLIQKGKQRGTLIKVDLKNVLPIDNENLPTDKFVRKIEEPSPTKEEEMTEREKNDIMGDAPLFDEDDEL